MNNITVLHVHKNPRDEVDNTVIFWEFASRNVVRMPDFGSNIASRVCAFYIKIIMTWFP